MKRHALARRKRHYGRMPVRKNFLPLVPFAIPIVLGGVSVAALVAMKKTAESYVSAPAILGSGAGFVIARVYKQDVPTQIAASLVGYTVGMMVANRMEEHKAVEAQKAADAEFSYFKPWTWFAA